MSGGKQSPRQKMIGMMYLVLTALLAMNVSKEVLLAFGVVEKGIEGATEVLIEKSETIDGAFVKQVEENPKDAIPLQKLSLESGEKLEGLVTYIDGIEDAIIKFAGGRVFDEVKNDSVPKSIDNIDAATQVLALKESELFQGEEFQAKINEMKASLESIIDRTPDMSDEEKAAEKKKLTLNADNYTELEEPDATRRAWFFKTFNSVPVVASTAILANIKSNAYSDVANVKDMLINRIGKLDFKFDKLRATVQAEKAYLPGGAQYEANIFLTASSSKMVAETYVGNLVWSKFKKDKDGEYEPFNSETETPFSGTPKKLDASGKLTRGTSVGQNGYSGAIKIANPKGGFDWYPFKGSYEGAAAGGFSASPTKMNVLYIGVDNPMSITVGDAKPGTLRASLSGGSISKSGNGWVAKVSKQGEATLTASGMTPDGKPTKSFTAKFRAKRIPDPVPTLGGKLKGGNIQKGTLAAQSGIIALLKDFDFDARFTVTGYNFVLVSKGEILPARGNSGPVLGSQVKNLLNRARPKDIAIFDKIKVKGPDGSSRTLPSLTFNII